MYNENGLYLSICYEDAPYEIYEIRNGFGDIIFSTYSREEAEEYIDAA